MVFRKLYIVTLLFLVASTGKSQSEEPRMYHWNIGVSAGDILHQLFNTDEPNKAYAAFLLEYSGQKYALQAGFRPGYNMKNVTHEGFVDSEVTESRSVSGHLAFTRILLSDGRWQIKAGLRYEGGYSREDIIEDSGFDRLTTRRLAWNGGAGPVLDFRFFVHPRISLSIDAALIYSYSQSELQQLFTNFPDFDTTKDKIIDRGLQVVEPATIYLRFHF